MRRHTFDEVSRLDNELYQLALYEVTKGEIILPKEMKQLMELQGKVAEKFNYYKQLIRTGECNVHFITQQVLAKYGPFSQESQLGDEWDYDKLTEYIREEDEDAIELGSYEEKASNMLDSLIDSFGKRLKYDESTDLYPYSDDEVGEEPPNFDDLLEDDDDDPIDCDWEENDDDK